MTETNTTTTAAAPLSGADGLPADDPRIAFAGAVSLGRAVIAAVRPDQLDAPTPCPDYDVRGLVGHLVAVVQRVAAVGRGEDPFSVAQVADLEPGDLAAPYITAAHDVQAVWSDATLLGRMITLPFATLPGAVALRIYTGEVSVHTWDLATATGQQPAWDAAVLEVALGAMTQGLPAEPRDEVPFAPVVHVPAGATLIDRLVAWTGRQP